MVQYENNAVYQNYVDALKIDPKSVNSIDSIPFLPISFFKTHEVKSTNFEPEIIFESSGTTGKNTSRHFVKSLSVYERSFTKAFQLFYGTPQRWSILGLLPGYLERGNSSLVKMVAELIAKSNNPQSNFYLHDHDKLYQTIVFNEIREQPTLLIGVTFSLLDFAEKYSMRLRYTTVMETGGMKGRREELTRQEVHELLRNKFGLHSVNSEYGMTELLSQAYSLNDGIFHTPPWMKVLIREINDPLTVHSIPNSSGPERGLINIIDLANLHSCSFIATDDVGKLYKNGSFEVLGRHDISDLRGCSLMTE